MSETYDLSPEAVEFVKETVYKDGKCGQCGLAVESTKPLNGSPPIIGLIGDRK